MKYDPQIHHRRSIRLRGYDYSQPGAYFVTTVVQTRENLLGQVVNGQMGLNQPGRMVEKWWCELGKKFSGVTPADFIIMPNHFHGIIEIDVFPPSQGGPGQPQKSTGLAEIVQWFKTMTTNEYMRGVKQLGWQPFAGRLWQRNYYEHIIRGMDEWEDICRYIQGNPANWTEDQLNQPPQR